MKNKRITKYAAIIMCAALIGCADNNKEYDTLENTAKAKTVTKSSKSEEDAISSDKDLLHDCAAAIVMTLADPDCFDDIAIPKEGIDTTVDGLLSMGGATWQKDVKEALGDINDRVLESEEAGKGVRVGDCHLTITYDSFDVTVESPNGKVKSVV